jgi:putative restriction endonuclease
VQASPSAFDANLMGVQPDHMIEVKRRMREEMGGPMLIHGLQGFEGQTITVPRRTELRPNRGFLEERYKLFRVAS